MNSRSIPRGAFLFAFAFSLAFLIAIAPARAGDDEDAARKIADTPKLSVRGQAELTRPADQVRMTIGVVTEGVEAADVLQENTVRMPTAPSPIWESQRSCTMGAVETSGSVPVNPRSAKARTNETPSRPE